MEKDKSPNSVGKLLPPSGRHLVFSSSSGNNFGSKPEPSGSTTLPPMGPGTTETVRFGGHEIPSDSGPFSHDISRMPDNPPKHLGHRRAHSEILTLPEDISFDSDLGVVGGFSGPSYSDETEEDLFSMYLDMDKLNSSSATSGFQVGDSSSCTVQTSEAATSQPENPVHSSGERPRVRHQHSQSMDGSTTIEPEMLTSGAEETSSAESKKSMSAAKLAELALVDPKRAKRIWANRQSAARSKERKMRYIAELERKVQALKTEATALSAQLTLMQRDTSGLTSENSDLKLRVQTMEQQCHLQDVLNDTLKDEIQHLKVLTGQTLANGGQLMNLPPSFGANQQFHPNSQARNTLLTVQQFRQLQIQSKTQEVQFQQQQQLRQFQEKHLPQMRSPGTSLSLNEHASDFNLNVPKD